MGMGGRGSKRRGWYIPVPDSLCVMSCLDTSPCLQKGLMLSNLCVKGGGGGARGGGGTYLFLILSLCYKSCLDTSLSL